MGVTEGQELSPANIHSKMLNKFSMVNGKIFHIIFICGFLGKLLN